MTIEQLPDTIYIDGPNWHLDVTRGEAYIRKSEYDRLAAEVARLGREKHTKAEIARLKAERDAEIDGPIHDLTDADMENIVAHLSYELEPQGPLPNRNSLMMEVVRLNNRLAAMQKRG